LFWVEGRKRLDKEDMGEGGMYVCTYVRTDEEHAGVRKESERACSISGALEWQESRKVTSILMGKPTRNSTAEYS
jgi:hypothetical protein